MKNGIFLSTRIKRQAIITSINEVDVVKRNAVDISPCTILEQSGIIVTHSTLMKHKRIKEIIEKRFSSDASMTPR